VSGPDREELAESVRRVYQLIAVLSITKRTRHVSVHKSGNKFDGKPNVLPHESELIAIQFGSRELISGVMGFRKLPHRAKSAQRFDMGVEPSLAP
jgi:hypothetical protein